MKARTRLSPGADKLQRDLQAAAAALPTETKRAFWKAMTEDGKNLGEARKIAGIEDVGIAAELFLQCHSEIYIPKPLEKIV